MKMFLLLLLFSASLLGGCSQSEEEGTVIFAASSLYETLENMRGSIEQYTGKAVTVHYGSSTQLLHQVKQGAQFDVFLSASPYDMEEMTDGGYTDASSVRTFIKNDLVLVTGDRETPEHPEIFLKQKGIGFLALGELNRVPLGVYTKKYLESEDVKTAADTTRVYGKDAFQVFRYVRVKQADAGIVYGSDARRTSYPHTPLESGVDIHYQLGVSHGAGEEARDTADWMMSPEAMDMFREGGFLPAGEEKVVWRNGGRR
ncbi:MULTISPECIES: molybdate ABC transporter substrate-binding protein [Salimicrobium]|uniref:Molybdate transport system substrate-binding protein n=2 Tax=Salimicrobium TaxID=351195 RepID=A0ABY1L0R0_9BACI|nr:MULTISPECIES: molybdate ABC transporter substrate-binding protein [Salimicrobium]SDX87273.1 molybdate transport system substrate-binding protein [Salimicrobium album]SIS88620.1 molybdate transport system substrate-binding protein [Salimicrobium salexigens]